MSVVRVIVILFRAFILARTGGLLQGGSRLRHQPDRRETAACDRNLPSR